MTKYDAGYVEIRSVKFNQIVVKDLKEIGVNLHLLKDSHQLQGFKPPSQVM